MKTCIKWIPLFDCVLNFQGWFYATELFHFVQFIAKGKTRNVEALYCPESAVVCQTEMWKQLHSQLDHSLVMGMDISLYS